MIRLVLPWPPSVNRMWRTVRLAGSQRTLLSAEARRYREATRVACAASQGPLTGRLKVTLFACPPDRRRRDLDNMTKAVLDVLQYALVIEDDSQIDDLRIIRLDRIAGGRMVVEIEELAT
jgi:crossover junction endodeoxyribonuclease RusA